MKALAKVREQQQQAAGLEVAVGFPAGVDGLTSPYYEDGASILDVALANNFGLDIPRRPFFDRAAEKIQRNAGKVLVEAYKRYAGNAEKALEFCGVWAQQVVITQILETLSPPNSAQTIAQKKSSHPLIDTGAMKNHVTFRVRSKTA